MKKASNTKKEEKIKIKSRVFTSTVLAEFPKIPPKSEINEIIIANTPISSFKGMESNESLETLNCDNTKIKSFEGACYQPNLVSINLGNTPVQKYTHYRIMALVAFGNSLRIIDHVTVKKHERISSKQIAEQIREYIRSGWILMMHTPLKLVHSETRARKVIYNKIAQEDRSEYFPPTSSYGRFSVARSRAFSPNSKSRLHFDDLRSYDSLASSALILIEIPQIEIIPKSCLELYQYLINLFFSSDSSDLLESKAKIKIFIQKDGLQAEIVFLNLVLLAINLRPLKMMEYVELFQCVWIQSPIESHLLVQTILSYPFKTHYLFAHLIQIFLDRNIIQPSFIRVLFNDYSYDSSEKSSLIPSPNVPLVSINEMYAIFKDILIQYDKEVLSFMELVIDEPDQLIVLNDCDFYPFEIIDKEKGLSIINGKEIQFTNIEEMKLAAASGVHISTECISIAIEYHQFVDNNEYSEEDMDAAIMYQNLNVINQLHEKDIKVLPRHYEFVIHSNNTELFHFLTNFEDFDPSNGNYLHIAIKNQNTNIVRILLSDARCPINTVDENGDTPLHISVDIQDSRVVALILQRYDVLINCQNSELNTPLHLAVMHESTEIAAFLLKYPGIDVNLINKSKLSPLMISCSKNNLQLVKLLLKVNGIDINQKTTLTAAHIIVQNGFIECLKAFLSMKDFDINTKIENTTILCLAIMNQHNNIAKLLLKQKGLDIASGKPNELAQKNGLHEIASLIDKYIKRNSN